MRESPAPCQPVVALHPAPPLPLRAVDMSWQGPDMQAAWALAADQGQQAPATAAVNPPAGGGWQRLGWELAAGTAAAAAGTAAGYEQQQQQQQPNDAATAAVEAEELGRAAECRRAALDILHDWGGTESALESLAGGGADQNVRQGAGNAAQLHQQAMPPPPPWLQQPGGVDGQQQPFRTPPPAPLAAAPAQPWPSPAAGPVAGAGRDVSQAVQLGLMMSHLAEAGCAQYFRFARLCCYSAACFCLPATGGVLLLV